MLLEAGADSKPPSIVAHRAGNDLQRLRRAQRLALPLVEADVHLFRGRLEVRHLKTLGPVPVLWDRWRLAPPWTPRPLLDDLLVAAGPHTPLMLDLKGRNPELSRRAAAALGERRAVTVCSRHWPLLDPFADLPGVCIVHSVGSRRQLSALRRRFAGRRLDGISIHRKLLDPAVVAELRHTTDLLMSWPVRTADEARLLGSWGVTAVICEDFETLAAGTAAGP